MKILDHALHTINMSFMSPLIWNGSSDLLCFVCITNISDVCRPVILWNVLSMGLVWSPNHGLLVQEECHSSVAVPLLCLIPGSPWCCFIPLLMMLTLASCLKWCGKKLFSVCFFFYISVCFVGGYKGDN